MTNSPPRLATRLLLSFLRDDLAEEVLGDLDEKFYSTSRKRSLFRARLDYWYQVLNYLRPFAIRKSRSANFNYTPMFKNYFKIGCRNLFKNKSYVAINTMGLGISLACCITVYLLLAFNIEFDSFHNDDKVADIFAVHTLSTQKDGSDARDHQAPLMFGPLAAQEISGIESYCRFLTGDGALRYADKAFTEHFAFADSTFFDLFDYPLTAGSHRSFKERNSIFLSEELATKYFGGDDPVGKMMTISSYNETEIEVIVGGVLSKIPPNNTFYFSAILPFQNFIQIARLKEDDWSDWRDPSTFVKLSTPGNASLISHQFDRYIPIRNKFRPDMVVKAYQLVPFKARFGDDEIRQKWVRDRMSNSAIIIFGSIALLILLIACFNLTNTSIAMTARRLKEVGVRKVVGASRGQVVLQFLFETLIIISISAALGFFLAQWIVPAFYTMWGLNLGMDDVQGLNLFVALILIVFLASLVAGIYPALLSSRLRPAALLKGSVRLKGTTSFTRSLVAMQFGLSVIVLVAGVFFTMNARFQEQIKFGYDTDMLVSVDIQGGREFELMETAILANPKIIAVAASDGNLGRSTYMTPIQVDTSEYNTQVLAVGKNFFETVGLHFLEGRPFNTDLTSDLAESAVVNRAFIEKTQIKDPIGKIIKIHGGKRAIVGVVENHIDNVVRTAEPEPFAFYVAPKNKYISLLVRAEASDLEEIEQYLEKTWKELFPGRPFESDTQDDLLLADVRMANANLEQIFFFITLLGGLLSVAGIFALTSLNIAKRTKEIGIRKALGATISNIVSLLNREFAIILAIAAVVGATGGYYATSLLLSTLFAYHVPVSLAPVVACGVVVFAMGLLTTSATILRAARANPVDTLRSE